MPIWLLLVSGMGLLAESEKSRHRCWYLPHGLHFPGAFHSHLVDSGEAMLNQSLCSCEMGIGGVRW